MPPELRRALARLARRHHGVATREQLLAVGMTDETITWALTTHQLVALFPGVYRVNGAPDTWRSRALAAQRRVERQLRRRTPADDLPPLAVVGGTSAAHLHGLPGHDRAPALTIVTSRRSRASGMAVQRRVALTSADVVEVDRIPTTSLAWTAVAAACEGPGGPCQDVIAHVLGTGRLRPGQLAGPARRTLTLPGRGALLRRLAELSGPVDHARSRAEHRLTDACNGQGLPAPACNHRVTTTAGPTYELDLAWNDERLDVEVDGPHHLLPSQRRQDRLRDRHLRADGWEVVRFPVEELDDDVEDVAQRIGAALRRRTPRPT